MTIKIGAVVGWWKNMGGKILNKQEKLYAIDECILDMQMTQRKISHVAKILNGIDIGDRKLKELALADSEVHEMLSKYEKTAQKVESEFLKCLQEILEIKQKYLIERTET
ncbi:hypothetical protein ACFSJM_11335 [Lactococcus formosensis subsp. bovis]|uniref:hypothetical protein n=1 Tax=Lactococcus formosensis TaxID=1281486 RepID=UPI001BCE7FC5|nr:hypothetical protein [Lactococcus formosensis]